LTWGIRIISIAVTYDYSNNFISIEEEVIVYRESMTISEKNYSYLAANHSRKNGTSFAQVITTPLPSSSDRTMDLLVN
jgi:hypothetical protein